MTQWDSRSDNPLRRSRPAENFLAAIASNGDCAIPADKLALVVAHPDDEVLGIGGLLGQLPGATTIHLTDGAPRRTSPVFRQGYATVEAYKAVRGKELEAALKMAGVPPERRIALEIPDQEVCSNLFDTTLKLARIFQGIGCEIVLTHPYEGGHPDHDAAAFCVRAAADLLAAEGVRPPAIVEMAFYHLAGSTRRNQRFVARADVRETVVTLTPDQRRMKQRMFEVFASQTSVLDDFAVDEERFRMAPRYDFSRPPNNGQILYETFDWDITADRWLQWVERACGEIARYRAEGTDPVARA